MKPLILFDINGTLIKRDSRTDLPYEYAVNELLSIENGLQGVNTSARSDVDVMMEILQKHNVEYTEALWEQFFKLYIKQLKEFKPSDAWRENGTAVSFVTKLAEKNYPLALITGELGIGAEYKLKKLGIWQHFATGGFGEDGLGRFEIADTAVKCAKERFNREFDKIFLIGDTVLDIKTARHIGASVISITTGSNTREELQELSPDYIIDDFTELSMDIFE